MTELERIEAALKAMERVPLKAVPDPYNPGLFIASRQDADPALYSTLISALRVATEALLSTRKVVRGSGVEFAIDDAFADIAEKLEGK